MEKEHKVYFQREKFDEIIRNNPDSLYELLNNLFEVVEINHQLNQKVAELTAKIEHQEERIKDLEAQLKKNSQNSSKPPSSDGYTKPPVTKSLRKKSNKKNGGQMGHTASMLEMSKTPDEVIRIPVLKC